MPPRFPPKQTVALVGIRCNCEEVDLKKVVDGLKKHLGELKVPSLVKDRTDVGTERENQRHFVFLNCKSHDDAKAVCNSLHGKRNEDLGIDKYQCVLQAVTKNNLSNLSWDELAQVEAQTVEGKISQKGKKSCKISDQSMTVFVEMEVFEGSEGDWDKLQLGDVLRVTAEKDKKSQANAEWKAKDAVLVSRALDEKSALKAAEAAVLEEAGQILDKCLKENLKGKGWISLQTIGPWFNGSTDVKDALQIVKSKHKQLKNFVAVNPLVEMKKNGTNFLIALAEDLERERASLGKAEVEKQILESIRAKDKVRAAEVVTEDETQDEREGRARSYRIQRAILELVPQILGPVFCHAWEQKNRKPWSQGSSGAELLGQIKNQDDVKKRAGKDWKKKVENGQSQWDITLFSLLLLDDPGLLAKKSAAASAVQTLRGLRNSFVHELHSKPALDQAEFDREWTQIKKLLGDLTAFVGKAEIQALLESESSKILAERVDAQKEAKFAKEFESMHGELMKLDDKVETMRAEMSALKKNNITQSVVGALVAEKVAEILREQQQKSSSPASAPSSDRNQVAVELDMLPGQTFSFIFGKDSPDKLGSGAQGSVYKAKCGSRVVALKVPELQAGSKMSQREWQNLKEIKHTNVVRFLGRGTLSHGGITFDVIGMEMAVGTSYDQFLLEQGGKLSWQEAAANFRQIISGMGAVHEKGILHRDLKGANIIRKKNGHILIVDFGLSKDTTSAMAATASVMGVLVGTPAYMSPEAENPASQTLASDVFTMGIIMYEILSGYLPWDGDVDSSARSKLSTLAEGGSQMVMFAYALNLQRKPPAPLDSSEAPDSISKFVFKCLAQKPDDRFPSAVAMLDPWDRAVEEAKETIKARSTEAQTFWQESFGEDESVDLARFKQVVVQKWAITDEAAQELAAKVDANGSGSIELEEFLKHFSEYSMAEVARQAQELAQQQKEKADTEPADVFYSRPLVMSDVKFSSKGTFLGGKKTRIGTLTLEAGAVVAKRYDGSRALLVYSFNVDKSEIVVSGPNIDLGHVGEKQRTFTFRTQADCDAFKVAVTATKAWQMS